MRKRILPSVIGILILCLLTACHGRHSLQEKISDACGVDISSGVIVTSSDSHGEFHGDGQLFASVNFSDNRIAEELSEDAAWHPLPLSKTLTTLVYGMQTADSQTGPYLKAANGTALFPEIQHGYYYFRDRQSEQPTDRHDDTSILDRYSFNFTIVIYDTDTNTLYYAELDT